MKGCGHPKAFVHPRGLKILFAIVDVGFVVYWVATLLHFIPVEWAFKDYENPILWAWNWSFLPLDLLISASGLASLWTARRSPRTSVFLTVLSLILTSCSGLMAVSFWALRLDFELGWWLPNLFLLVYPIPYGIILSRMDLREESLRFRRHVF